MFMARQNGSLVVALMALLTLVMAMLLPIIGNNSFSSNTQENNPSSISPQMQSLDRQRSALARVEGGVFFRGTTPEEVQNALSLCAARDITCDIASAEDSYPPHQLLISTFWMETTEVTYRQYVAFLNTLGPGGHLNGCLGEFCVMTTTEAETSSIKFENGQYVLTNPAIGAYPVVDVTWYGAYAYCNTLERRLPTEGEWEYAARGSRGTAYPWGNEWTYHAANVRGSVTNSDGVIIAGPQPAGSSADGASRDGIRDLAGNVAEWVADWYAHNHYLTTAASRDDDPGPASGVERVIRGGSWDDPAFYARSAHRDSMLPNKTASNVGFRCVADS